MGYRFWFDSVVFLAVDRPNNQETEWFIITLQNELGCLQEFVYPFLGDEPADKAHHFGLGVDFE